MSSYASIVIGTDLSAHAEESVANAVQVALRLGVHRIHVVHVVHASVLPLAMGTDPQHDTTTQAALAEAKRQLDALVISSKDVTVSRDVRIGSPARELARVADELHADLVIVQRHDSHGLARLLGSVPNALIRVAHCPVLVMGKATAEGRFDHILAAIDLSAVSALVLDRALAVARPNDSMVRVVSFYEPPILGAAADQLLPQIFGAADMEAAESRHRDAVHGLVRRSPRGGLSVEVDVMRRFPVSAGILEAAQSDVHLVVVGTSGRNAWHRMILGSTAHNVLSGAPCAVLVVPPTVRERSTQVADALAAQPVLGGEG